MIAAGGRQFDDWSATYRLFENDRIDIDILFKPAIRHVLDNTPSSEALYVMMDDTLIRKRGKRTAGVAWRRDPLGPAFHVNFVLGQRFLQLSAALPDTSRNGQARAIPIGFYHAPSATKPRKKDPPEAWAYYREQQKSTRLPACGAMRLAALRQAVPDRKIICAVDGGYTNQEMFRSIPDNTVLIGRIRKDASIFAVPDVATSSSRGRRRFYGEKLPTPEQCRQNEDLPWQTVEAFAAGKRHKFNIKVISPVRWKSSGDKDVALLVIRPLSYRPRKNSRLLYRQPAYLICSDTTMPPADIVQAYLWRWEIEVNFREEKTVFGVGEAQVRTKAAVRTAPAFMVACYSFLLLAAHNVDCKADTIPPPKWYPQAAYTRPSTQRLISQFRSERWSLDVKGNKTDFVSLAPGSQSPLNYPNSLVSAACYAIK